MPLIFLTDIWILIYWKEEDSVSVMHEVDIQPVEDKFVGTHCEVKIRSKLYKGVNAAFEVLCKKDTV